MALLDSLRDLLKQYSAGGVANTANAAEHFDQVSKVAPRKPLPMGCRPSFAQIRHPPSATWWVRYSANRTASKRPDC